MRYAVIMAGGAGTRLWPASRASRPKQLLRLLGGKSLLRESYDRVAGMLPPESVCVITGADHLALVADELPEVPPSNLLGEPCGRDTANAIGLAAAILRRRDADAVMGVFTADHVIRPLNRFEQAMERGYRAAEEHPDALVTFGIRPTIPHTGYGYVQRGGEIGEGVYEVQRFVEKPDQATATEYVQDGRYYWNSGMFVWHVGTILDQLQSHLALSYCAVTEIADAWDTPAGKDAMDRLYPGLQKISIDFAVMEKAPRVLVIETDCDWVDVGSWTSLPGVIAPDEDDNVAAAERTIHRDSRGMICVSEDDHLIATLGVENVIVVHTPDATLVCHKDQAQQLRELVADLKARFGDRYL